MVKVEGSSNLVFEKRTSLETPVNSYSRVARVVEDYLQQFVSPSADLMSTLREKMKNFETDINYDTFGPAFARLYWLRNYWKAAYCFENLVNLNFVHNVTVLGAGAGADTVALLTALYDHSSSRHVKINLIDRSAIQLDMAQKLVSLTTKTLGGGIQIKVERKKIDVKKWIPNSDEVDLVLISHLLTENPRDIDSIMKKAFDTVRPTGSIVVIERERDPVWQNAKDAMLKIGVQTADVGVEKSKLQILLQRVGTDGKRFANMTPKYVIATVAAHKIFN